MTPITPKTVRDVFHTKEPKRTGWVSDVAVRQAEFALEAGKKIYPFRLELVALLWYSAPEFLEKENPPPLGAGDEVTDKLAAELHWEQSILAGIFAPFEEYRQAVYSTNTEKNIDAGEKFWRIALRLGLSNPKMAGRGIFPWKFGVGVEMIAGGAMNDFRKENMNPNFSKTGSLTPAENRVSFSSPDKMTINTRVAWPDNVKDALDNTLGSMEELPASYTTTVSRNGEMLDIHIGGEGRMDKERNTPRALAIGLFDILTLQQYDKARITTGGKPEHDLARDYLLSALTIDDVEVPHWDGDMLERVETEGVRPALYIGLSEAVLSGTRLIPRNPAAKQFAIDLSPEETQAARQYLQWGKLNDNETPPAGVRMPGVV